MDLKGQHFCERVFLGIMWTTTILAAVLTFVLDEVFAMFVTFAAGLSISAVVRYAALYLRSSSSVAEFFNERSKSASNNPFLSAGLSP